MVRLNEPSAAADYPAPSGAVAALTRTVQARSACSACYASLVRALHTGGVRGIPIAIGQGWRGFPSTALGSAPAATAPKSASRAARPRQRTSCASSPPTAEPHGECAPDFPPKSGAFLRTGGEPLQIRYLHRLLSPVQ
ncbi:hypothetical protein M5E87_11920 [Flavonifractor plautii]|nr:hypothetical protein M5E87_11920 [Flavonifractor plautii]